MNKVDLRNLTYSQLQEAIAALGVPPSRAEHIFSWLYQIGSKNIADMGIVKREIREVLARYFFVSTVALAKQEQSEDGTIKYAFRLADNAIVESVLIPGNGRYTLCVSSQVGCAMGCRFCLTGRMGFVRNLTSAEIVNQVVAVMELMVQNGIVRSSARELINNLVFMGMGEPLANYDNLIDALAILMDQRGFEFTERRLTVSTCGVVPRIKSLGIDAKVNLAISLHAADDDTRNSLMPINSQYAMDELLSACRNYPLSRRRVILFEYILIKGVNDSVADAVKLADKLAGISCRINLMPYNESEDLPYACPENGTIKQFQQVLREAGYTALIRNSRGADISAACGQLAGRS